MNWIEAIELRGKMFIHISCSFYSGSTWYFISFPFHSVFDSWRCLFISFRFTFSLVHILSSVFRQFVSFHLISTQLIRQRMYKNHLLLCILFTCSFKFSSCTRNCIIAMKCEKCIWHSVPECIHTLWRGEVKRHERKKQQQHRASLQTTAQPTQLSDMQMQWNFNQIKWREIFSFFFKGKICRWCEM